MYPRNRACRGFLLRTAVRVRYRVRTVMVTLMLLGLLWIVVFYVAGDRIPFMQSLGSWNFAVGFGAMVAGLIMSMRWR